ncbi:MAG: cyanophycin synthetase, partial [Chloroflexota bacterium]
DPGAMKIATEHRKNKRLVFTYGLSENAIFRANNIATNDDGTTSFDVMQGQTNHGRATLQLPGLHNVRNALAALYVAGVGHDRALADVIPHLATFRGTGRRFEVRADVNGIAVVDDYAHHPTAIHTTIDAARSRYAGRELWVVWQPHTFTRTKMLWEGYLSAFAEADHVLITDIYAAREEPLEGISGETVAAAMNHADVRHTGTLENTAHTLIEEVTAPAVVLIMSAGDAPQIGIDFLAERNP